MLGVVLTAILTGQGETARGLLPFLFIPSLVWAGGELLMLVNPTEEKRGWKVLLLANPATLFFVCFVMPPMWAVMKVLQALGIPDVTRGVSAWLQWATFHLIVNVILLLLLLAIVLTSHG
jgi:hypothetical protein